jgi:hypothetical protein
VRLDRRRDRDDYAERLYRGVRASQDTPANDRARARHLGPTKRP